MEFNQILELIDHVSASELTAFTYETADLTLSMEHGKPQIIQGVMGETVENIPAAGMAGGKVRRAVHTYYIDHTVGIWPQAAGGIPFNACEFQSKGDAITDLTEDMAAEQKARSTYENLIRLTDDPDVLDPLRFLREREIVHFQRFGEALSMIQDSLNSKNFYAFNPEFDKGCK